VAGINSCWSRGGPSIGHSIIVCCKERKKPKLLVGKIMVRSDLTLGFGCWIWRSRTGREGKGMCGHTRVGCSSPAKRPTKNWRAAALALSSPLGKEEAEAEAETERDKAWRVAACPRRVGEERERERERETDVGQAHGPARRPIQASPCGSCWAAFSTASRRFVPWAHAIRSDAGAGGWAIPRPRRTMTRGPSARFRSTTRRTYPPNQ
jgi:hypothetical protein